MKKVLILLLVGSHCADISTSPPQNRMALSFFLNFRSLGSMFLYFLSSGGRGRGAGAGGEVRQRERTQKHQTVQKSGCPRHDLSNQRGKTKGFFLKKILFPCVSVVTSGCSCE